MQILNRPPLATLSFAAILAVGVTSGSAVAATQDSETDFGAVFDEHWERLRDDYAYFEFYGVDWEAERAEHRPRAAAAENGTEFAWEMARLLTALDDAHVAYMPPLDVMREWSVPDVRTARIEGRLHVVEWGEDLPPLGPSRFRDEPLACPEIVSVQGAPVGSAVQILAAGPGGSTFQMRLRWPDGTETDEELVRPVKKITLPSSRHHGERWIASGRVGSIGYLCVKTFDPSQCTLGPEGKMTPILRAHVAALGDTDGLILDLQDNGGGAVAASDPFLCNFLTERLSYRWGNSGGKSRVLRPRKPRYEGAVVALVSEKSASGGEWAARILRDAGRAKVVGGPTAGAEAAVERSTASDGSWIAFSAWPMVEPGVTPIQGRGVELDHAIPVTIEDVRAHGYDEARALARRARFAKALEVLGAPAEDLAALLELADEADREEETVTRVR